jgi:tellurite methyltransferase
VHRVGTPLLEPNAFIPVDLRAQFGDIDIYPFDQLLRGRIRPGMRIFDAGCGEGRNLGYLLRAGYDVSGADADADSITSIRRMAAALAPHLPAGNFRSEQLERTTFPDSSADVVLSSAVLHFAQNDAHFDAMLQGMWRILKPEGLFFCRLASSIGMKHQVEPISGRRCRLPDGSERYPVDEQLLLEKTDALGRNGSIP